MAAAVNKTQPTDGNVETFLHAIEHEGRRQDSFEMLDIMTRLSGYPAVLWGSIVGFGHYHYAYEKKHDDLLSRLGTFKIGKSCLYMTRLSKVDRAVLEDLIAQSLAHMRAKYQVT